MQGHRRITVLLAGPLVPRVARRTRPARKLVALALVTLALCASPAFAGGRKKGTAAFDVAAAVVPGQKLDETRTISYVRELGFQGLNNAGVVAFSAGVANGSSFEQGVYTWDGTSITPILVGPVAVGNQVVDPLELARPALNDKGTVVFIRPHVVEDGQIENSLSVSSNGTVRDLLGLGDQIATDDDGEPILVKSVAADPIVNRDDEIGITAITRYPGDGEGDFVLKLVDGVPRVLARQGDVSPLGGQYFLDFIPQQRAWVADNGDLMFVSYILAPENPPGTGLFAVRHDGSIDVPILETESLPSGGTVLSPGAAVGSLGPDGDAVFLVTVDDATVTSGIYTSSHGALTTIMTDAQTSPLGGRFLPIYDYDHIDTSDLRNDHRPPLLNGKAQVLMRLDAEDSHGKTRDALFLANASACVKVVAVGDPLPNGGRVGALGGYSLNASGQVAFQATPPHFGPGAVYVATPAAPVVTRAKLKGSGGAATLTLTGSGFVVGDAVVEIDGSAVGGVSSVRTKDPHDGTTGTLVVNSPDLAGALPPGSTVRITVYNPLTDRRSAALSFTVPTR